MRAIFGIENVKLIDEDGSPTGHKEFICWNTPYKDPNDPSLGRDDCVAESAKLFIQLILRGVRVIIFCRVRKVCETLLLAIRNELKRMERPEVTKRVMAYRGGYSPQDRRNIEKEMFEGRLLGIVATNALELGVDIGPLGMYYCLRSFLTDKYRRCGDGRISLQHLQPPSAVWPCWPSE